MAARGTACGRWRGASDGCARAVVARRPGGRGFTVLEIMLAMGVFVVGFVAVLTLFPAAIVLQKQTVQDLEVQRVVQDATALLRARPWTAWRIPPNNIGTLRQEITDANLYLLYPLLNDAELTDPLNGNGVLWSPVDRSFPRQTGSWSSPQAPSYNVRHLDGREARYFWVPLVKRLKVNADNPTAEDWTLFLCILRQEEHPVYCDPPTSTNWNIRYDGARAMNQFTTSNLNNPASEFVPRLLRQTLQWPATPPTPVTRFYFAPAGANRVNPADAMDGVAGFLVKSGDMVLGSNGVVYRVVATDDADGDGVVDADEGEWIMVSPEITGDGVVPGVTPPLPQEIWFAPPPSRRTSTGQYKVDTTKGSPLVRVEVVKGAIR